jgi:hypothetical protein
VRGPVLAPPCIRQRPLPIAGARHFFPRRVLAPHLVALFGSPGGLSFFNLPRPLARVLFVSIFIIAVLPIDSGILLAYLSYDGLPTLVDVDMFDGHSLFTLAAVAA